MGSRVKNWFENIRKEYIFIFSNISENKVSVKEGISFLLTKYNEFIKEIKLLSSNNDYFPEIYIQKLKDAIDAGKSFVIAKFKKNLLSKMQYLCVQLYEKGIETYISKNSKRKIIFNPKDLVEDDLIKQRRDIVETVKQEDKDWQEKKLIADEKQRLKLAKKGINLNELTTKKEVTDLLETDNIDEDQNIIESNKVCEPFKQPEFNDIQICDFDARELNNSMKPKTAIEKSQDMENFVDNYLKESVQNEKDLLADDNDESMSINDQKLQIDDDDDISFLFKDIDNLNQKIPDIKKSNQVETKNDELPDFGFDGEFDLINDDLELPVSKENNEKPNNLNNLNPPNFVDFHPNLTTNQGLNPSNQTINFDFGGQEIQPINAKFD